MVADLGYSTDQKSAPRRANDRGHGTEGVASMQAERTALSTAAVKREIRKIVAKNGHKLTAFDRNGLAECEYCKAVMVDDDAHTHLAGQDTLGSFNENCPQDDRAALIFWYARLLREGESIAIPGIDLWLTRSKSGLRFAYGWCSLSWPRGDVEQMVRERVEAWLDWRQMGYDASRYRSEIDMWLRKPTAVRLLHIGRTSAACDRTYERGLL